ncbi:MAG: DUF1232 domain-containing protein [Candidatus Hydrogenedentes bacterium]|nr:DUF1232 domain-containing protein [Candidatus Hydrogenedentota bacterium]
MRPALRELLLEARQRPLTEREVLFYLADGQPGAAPPPHVREEIQAVADAGLLEYSRDTGKVYPTRLLEQSYLPQPVAAAIDTLSTLAGGIVLLLAGGYFLMPIDFLPEAFLGPIGYIDDLILLAIGSMPLGARVIGGVKGMIGRGKG